MSSRRYDRDGRVAETIPFGDPQEGLDSPQEGLDLADDSLFDSFRAQVCKKITKTERDRIRAEFAAWIRSLPDPATINRDYFLAQLDLICPKD